MRIIEIVVSPKGETTVQTKGYAGSDWVQARILRELLSDQPDDIPTSEGLDRVLDAAAGVTRYEAEGAYALSLAKHNQVRPDVLTELKAGMLKKSNLLTLHRGTESLADLGGLGNLKEFCRGALQSSKAVKPRGVLLIGEPEALAPGVLLSKHRA